MRLLLIVTLMFGTSGCAALAGAVVQGAVYATGALIVGVGEAAVASANAPTVTDTDRCLELMKHSHKIEVAKHDWPDAPQCAVETTRTGEWSWAIRSCDAQYACEAYGERAEDYRCRRVERT